MITLDRVLIALLLLCCIYSASGESSSTVSGVSLVTGKPVTVRPINARKESQEEVVLGEYFEVTLAKVEVVHGTFTGRSVSFEIFASHRESISESSSIYVLLRSDGNEVRALSWATPIKVVCFPDAVLDSHPIEEKFFLSNMRSGDLCTNAEWYR